MTDPRTALVLANPYALWSTFGLKMLQMSTAAAQVQTHRPDVVFVTSPNNPTGTSAPLALIEEVYDAAPGLVVGTWPPPTLPTAPEGW